MSFKDKIARTVSQVATSSTNYITNIKLQQAQSNTTAGLATVTAISGNQLTVDLNGSSQQVILTTSRQVGIGSVVAVPSQGIAI